jgi:hypothetical protein
VKENRDFYLVLRKIERAMKYIATSEYTKDILAQGVKEKMFDESL